LRVEVEKQIDVAAGALGTACCGTKQGEVFNAELVKTRRGSAENVKNRREVLRAAGGRSDSFVSQDRAAWDKGDTGRLKSGPNGGEIGRNGFALGTLKVGKGEPRNAGLLGQLSLSDAEECTAGAAHFRGK
jgi:hypothetical protein